MPHNALRSVEGTVRLFPAGHPLERLVAPSFDSIRRSLAGRFISSIWVDSGHDPSRAGFRPSYDDKYGPGSVNVMPFTATWLSTGPGEEPEGNTILLPAAIDRTAVDWMQRHGLLGRVEYVDGIGHLKRLVAASGRKVYSIDDLGEEFDAHSDVTAPMSKWLNAKDDLASLSRFAPRELVKDMYEVTAEDYHRVRGGGGRVFLKTSNTESAGQGVFICNDLAEFEAHLAHNRERQAKWGLNRRLVIQAEIRGRNRSFQVFLDPARPAELQVAAVTDQLVEADGKTYKGSVNYPITAANVEKVGPAMLDMVDRIRARHPDAFGFLMCDYFETDDGVVIYDPGLRPTGNTATAMALHFARKLTGEDLFVSNFHLRSGVNGLKFADFAERMGALVDPEELARTRTGVLPWGWNDILGFGVLIGVAPDEGSFEELRDRVLGAFGVAG
jgi:hypothetical protein